MVAHKFRTENALLQGTKEVQGHQIERAIAAGPKSQGPKRHPTAEHKVKKTPQHFPEQQTKGPGWSHISKGGKIVKPKSKQLRRSETFAKGVKVANVTPPNPSLKHSPPNLTE